MQMWLTLTRADAIVPVHVNMELVTNMWRSTDRTHLNFSKDHHVAVKEKPEEIRARVFSQTSERRLSSD
jgi:hypothetical protein